MLICDCLITTTYPFKLQIGTLFKRKNGMLEGWEWIIIGVVAVVIILWGPAKIPEFARALGRAKGEFSKATEEFKEAARDTPPTTDSHPALKNQKSKDEILIDTARSLGISTEGKTKEQLTEEISFKLNQLKAD